MLLIDHCSLLLLKLSFVLRVELVEELSPPPPGGDLRGGHESCWGARRRFFLVLLPSLRLDNMLPSLIFARTSLQAQLVRAHCRVLNDRDTFRFGTSLIHRLHSLLLSPDRARTEKNFYPDANR